MTFENVHDDIQSRHARHRHVILGLDSSYLAPTRHAWPQDVMPDPTGHHSFFNASAGLVRAALRVCQRTEAREIAKADTAARTYIHGF